MDLSSGYPFWLIKHGLPYDYKPLQKEIKTDVLVIGGGITGALVSYYLTKAGLKNVVVDKRTIGLGSTCASTALLQYEIDEPLVNLQQKVGLYNAVRAYRLCSEAIDIIETISNKIKFTDFNRVSSIYYSASEKDISFLKSEFDIRQKHGFDVKLLSKAQIKSSYNFEADSAIQSSQAAQTNAYMLAHTLHQYNIQNGAQVYDRTEVKKITHLNDAAEITTVNGYSIHAKNVVHATGYEAEQYIDKKIVKLLSTYAICSEQMEPADLPFGNNKVLWNTAEPYLYLRTTSDNRIIIGGRDENISDSKKRDELLDKKTKSLIKDFNKLYPNSNFKQEFSWCGTFGETKDGLPYIGMYNKVPNSYFALGYGGNGITFSVIAAEIIKDLIIGKRNTDAEIFSFNR